MPLPCSGIFKRRHVDQIAKAEALGFFDERLVHDRKLRNTFGNGREPLRVSPRGNDLHVLLRIDAEPLQGETKPHFRDAAESIDRADLPAQLLGARDAGRADNVIDESRDDRQDHHCVNAAEPGIDHIWRGRDDDVEVSRHQRLHRRRPGAKKDRFNQQTLFR